jgi:hypothetical protein
VCWTLKRISTMVSPPAALIVKGGTSLSKVYRAIDRFSEDVDLSFDRAALGSGGTNDPANASSKKQADKRVEGSRDREKRPGARSEGSCPHREDGFPFGAASEANPNEHRDGRECRVLRSPCRHAAPRASAPSRVATAVARIVRGPFGSTPAAFRVRGCETNDNEPTCWRTGTQ